MAMILKRMLTILLLAPLMALAAAPADAGSRPAEIQEEIQAKTPAVMKQQLQDYYFSAARRGNTEMLQEFVDASYNLDTRTEQGYTGLILAAYQGHAAAVELLLKAGADPCAEDRRGNTALLGAIFKGELRIARRLMGTACRPDQRNHAGQTPAMYAALFQRSAILQELVTQGADVEATDRAGNTATSLGRGEFK
jgi:ankyrin repeat protein